MNRRIVAWLNLAYHFWKHVLTRLWLRPFRRGRDLERFTAAVRPEGYLPVLPAERDAFPAMMRCIHCGLCAIACPAIREAPHSAWDETWTFVAGPSRSIDRAVLAAASTEPCTRCDVCTAVCPTGVPITQLAAMVTRLAESARSAA